MHTRFVCTESLIFFAFKIFFINLIFCIKLFCQAQPSSSSSWLRWLYFHFLQPTQPPTRPPWESLFLEFLVKLQFTNELSLVICQNLVPSFMLQGFYSKKLAGFTNDFFYCFRHFQSFPNFDVLLIF